MKLFISGSKSISELPDEVKLLLDDHMANGTEFLVGDCYGVDAAVQKYLASKGYSKVIIYCSGETPRNNFATGVKVHSCAEAAKGLTGRAFHYIKDIQMAKGLLEDGVPMEIIVRRTGLSEEDIRKP
jgi:hypothetical protein